MRTNLIMDLFIRGLGLLRLFITPLILNTSEYGSLGLVSAFFLYANFADLGLQIHYEVISTMEPSEIQKEINWLLKKLIPRLILCGGALSFIIYNEFHSALLAISSLLYVITLNIDTLYQIILRQQKIYNRLASAVFTQAFLLTFLIAPAAHFLRVEGVILLQALTPLASIAIGIITVNDLTKKHSTSTSNDRVQVFDSSMTLWLLLGQIQMMIWVTTDRFFLSHMINLSDLGLWNLGNMAGAVLLGFANTWGTLKFPLWKKEKHKIVEFKFLATLFGIYFAGVVGLILSTRFILKKYADGLPWNIAWLTVMVLISLIFIIDAFVRSQMKTKNDAQKWFQQKLFAQLVSAAFIAFFALILKLDPRASLCYGMIISFAIIFCFAYKRIKSYA